MSASGDWYERNESLKSYIRDCVTALGMDEFGVALVAGVGR